MLTLCLDRLVPDKLGGKNFCYQVTLTYCWDLQCWLSGKTVCGNRCWLLSICSFPSLVLCFSAAVCPLCCSKSESAANLPAAQHRSWLASLVNSIIGVISNTIIGIVVRFSANELNSNEHICFYSRLTKVLQGYNGLIFCHVCFRRVTNVTIGHGGGQ